MLSDTASAKASYERFIERVRKNDGVWALQSPDSGWAYCPSHEDEGVDVLLFWSDRADAARHLKEEWKDYTPTSVPTEEFIDAWLKGMQEDGVLAGLNWDANLSGLEVSPAEVANRLLEDDAP